MNHIIKPYVVQIEHYFSITQTNSSIHAHNPNLNSYNFLNVFKIGIPLEWCLFVFYLMLNAIYFWALDVCF